MHALAEQEHIDLDAIEQIALLSVRRASVFLGLGLHAAGDDRLKDYSLSDITQIRIMPPELDDETVASFKREFGRWIVTGGLRELIESFSVYLDAIHSACVKMAIRRGTMDGTHVKGVVWKFLRGGLSDKLGILESSFKVSTAHAKDLLSINQARNCLAHRRGVVGLQDCSSGHLCEVSWIGVDIAMHKPSGEEIELGPENLSDGIVWEKDAQLLVRRHRRQRQYNVGERISFSAKDLEEMCNVVIWSANDIKRTTIDYARGVGVEVRLRE